MRYFLLILLSVLLFTACQKSQPQMVASATAKRFVLHGKIVAADKAKKKVTVAHDDIAGYMPAMTMEFPVKNEFVFDALSKDAEIRADLVVDDAQGAFWLENISVVAAPDPNQPALPINENFVQIGTELPNFTLVNQDGKRISTNDFRGKALAITFIYTRCPLPNYCILMSKNFSDIALQLQNNPDLKDKIRLLSISFDPQNDTPETLKKYGLGYLGKDAKPDFTVWQLATGTDKEIKNIAEFFGLRYEPDATDKTQINHSLITAVIAPDGKVQKIFAGNEWTTNDLLRELQATLK
ncbi:MAG: SCO family protein [Pyrinomonadaceae bacterium]